MGNRVPARDLLFGDVPIERWALDDPRWQQVRRLLARRSPEAIVELRKIAAGTESLHALQAWNELRQLEIEPPPGIAREVLGIVFEPQLRAVYADGSVWQDGRWTHDPGAQAIIAEARPAAKSGAISRKPPPGTSHATLLTPSGMIAI